MTTTTLTLGEATLTVETSALFAAWAEKNLRPASPQPSHPAPRQGERYIGTVIRPDGSGHYLYRMPLNNDQRLDWDEAMTYALHQGGELPDRVEGALMFATRTPGEFADEAYWTREHSAGNDAYAWCQLFSGGSQYGDHKISPLRVVLVRRVAIAELRGRPLADGPA